VLAALLLNLLNATDAGVLLSRPVEISAPRVRADNKAHRATYEGGVTAVRDAMTLTCDRLEVAYEGEGVTLLTALGHVVAIEGDREAHGDQAVYDNRTGVLVATGNPWGRQGKREVAGDVITFTTGIDRLVIDKARTRSVEAKTGAVVIDADTLVLEQQQATAVWKGHVKAVRGPTTLTAPELEATWDEAGTITRMVATGGVDAVEPKRRARGQRADYDARKGVLVVTGHPEAHTDNVHQRGTKVTFFPDSDFIEVENATTIINVKKGKK
jgi:lipopolysaccharide transport protein LptA